MERSEIEKTVTGIVCEQLGVAESEVNTDSSFVDDLGADSLDTVELVMALEEEFDLEIADEDAEKISTVAGLMGNSGQVNYSSSKSAMVGFSRSLAKELGSRNITSNVVAPGFIETDMTTFLNDDEKVEVSKNIPMKRFGTVQDVAKCIVFLASDEANYITGQTISVDGGLFMY